MKGSFSLISHQNLWTKSVCHCDVENNSVSSGNWPLWCKKAVQKFSSLFIIIINYNLGTLARCQYISRSLFCVSQAGSTAKRGSKFVIFQLKEVLFLTKVTFFLKEL